MVKWLYKIRRPYCRFCVATFVGKDLFVMPDYDGPILYVNGDLEMVSK